MLGLFGVHLSIRRAPQKEEKKDKQKIKGEKEKRTISEKEHFKRKNVQKVKFHKHWSSSSTSRHRNLQISDDLY